MANSNIGVSAMDALQPQGGTGQAPRVPGLSPQQAVKILSLRVPERASQGAIAPLPLLTSKGSAQAGAQGLDTLIAALMQAFRPQTAGAGPQAPLTGGSDTYAGWRNTERNLGGGPSAPSDGTPYDAGTGFNPIPRQGPQQSDVEATLSRFPTPQPDVPYTPSPGLPPSVQFDTPSSEPPSAPPSLFDNGPAAPSPDTAPLWDWRRDKYGDGLDLQGF